MVEIIHFSPYENLKETIPEADADLCCLPVKEWSLLLADLKFKNFKETSLENVLVNNELIKLLKNIPDTTIWGIGIRIAFCTNYDPLLLLSDLRSQAQDNPEVLQSIIGQKAFELLMANA